MCGPTKQIQRAQRLLTVAASPSWHASSARNAGERASCRKVCRSTCGSNAGSVIAATSSGSTSRAVSIASWDPWGLTPGGTEQWRACTPVSLKRSRQLIDSLPRWSSQARRVMISNWWWWTSAVGWSHDRARTKTLVSGVTDPAVLRWRSGCDADVERCQAVAADACGSWHRRR